MAFMKVNKRLWVDVPSGHLYGFPKIWSPEKDGSLSQWLIRRGYPEAELKRNSHAIRYWEAKENEYSN